MTVVTTQQRDDFALGWGSACERAGLGQNVTFYVHKEGGGAHAEVIRGTESGCLTDIRQGIGRMWALKPSV